jgi:hypothetical protein
MLQKIKNIQDVVKDALIRYPKYRDDDNKLVAYIWWKHLKNNNIPEDIIAMDFLQLYAKNELPQADAITRARRKVQEENPELRGELYNERHQLKEEVKNNINK